MTALSAEQYELFINPRSVAMVGVTKKTGPGSYNNMEIMLGGGFKGRVYPVNPGSTEILGQQCYATVLDLPEVPDLAVISTPRAAVLGVVKECAAKGIKQIIIITQGFSDGDEEGAALQREITAVVRDAGMRLVGPNTLGVVNNYNSLNTGFLNFVNKFSPVGVLCQSGIFLAAGAELVNGVGIGIDTGNTGDVDFADILEHMAADSRLKAINLHVEGIRDGRKFMAAAGRTASVKPVLVLKTGRSEAGARAAGSHSGSLAGEDQVYDAAFRQCNLIRVADVEELRDLNKAFTTHRGMAGSRLGVVTITGGGGITAVDAMERYGLEVARLGEKTMGILREFFPAWMSPGNPVDVWPASMSRGYHQVFRQTLEAVLADEGVDAVVCVIASYLPPKEDYLDVTGVIKEAAGARPDKPVVVWPFGGHSGDYIAALEEGGVVTAYHSADRAVRALAALYRYNNREIGCKGDFPAAPAGIDRNKVAGILEGRSQGQLPAGDVMAVLEACGIPVVKSSQAGTKEDAVRAAGELGYPVAMKIKSPDIVHKTDVGGVKLNLSGPEEVARAYDNIMEAVGNNCPGAQIEGVLLQQFRSGGVELLLGGKQDPQFGPVLVCGAGGIYTELLRDVSFRVAPVTGSEALSMLAETRVEKMLRGFRGMPPADMDAVLDCLVRLSLLISEFPAIKGLDINPLLAGPEGVVALDARIELGE